LLAQEAPDLLEKYQAVWDVARAGGKIYAVPNQQLWPRVYTFYIRTAITDKYPIDWEKVGNGIQGLKDVLAWGKTVMEGEPDLVALTAGGVSGLGTGVGTFNESEVFGYSRIMGNWFPAVVKFDDPARKVLNETEVPYFMELAKVAREYEINKLVQPADLTPEEYTANWKAEKYAGDFWMFGPSMYAPIPQPWCNNCTFDGKKYIGAKFLDTGSIQATMTAVCATSKQPKAAMQVLRMAQTDADFHNGLYYGLEGQDWIWVDKATKQIKYAEGVDAAMPPYLTYNWMYGDTFLDYYLGPEMAAADPNKVSIQINATAPVASTLGFVFDPTPVSAEIAQINAVVTEQYGNIVTGRAEDPEAAVAKYQKDLKAAGVDKVIVEIQKQIDAWAASK